MPSEQRYNRRARQFRFRRRVHSSTCVACFVNEYVLFCFVLQIKTHSFTKNKTYAYKNQNTFYACFVNTECTRVVCSAKSAEQTMTNQLLRPSKTNPTHHRHQTLPPHLHIIAHGPQSVCNVILQLRDRRRPPRILADPTATFALLPCMHGGLPPLSPYSACGLSCTASGYSGNF
jgi:hypothetical protein